MKFSLTAQIEEIDRELAQRRDVYPRLVATGRLKEGAAKYQTDRLLAVRATLAWLQDNESTIKQRLGQ